MLTYVTVLTSGDLAHLGGDTEAERMSAWQNIQDEYEAAIMNREIELEITNRLEYQKLILDIARIATIIRAIQTVGLIAPLKEELQEEGYFIEHISELTQVINQSKQLEILRDNMEKKMAAEDVKDETKITKAVFVSCCMRFSDHKKYSIRLDAITALEFCLHYKDYLSYIKMLEKSGGKANIY